MKGAAPPASLLPGLLDYIVLLQCELQQTVLHLLRTRDLHALRLASKRVRALVSKHVLSIKLAGKDLDSKYWLLHTRFPALRTLAISDVAYSLKEDRFADFAVSQLKLLTSLVELDISMCRTLPTKSVATVACCCPQLESLNVPRNGKPNACQQVGLVDYDDFGY